MPNTLILCRYNPGRGGHAPSYLREAFLEVIEDLPGWRPGMLEPIAEVHERAVPLSVLCGLLWNCPDLLPGLEACEVERLSGRRVSTYASAARAIKAMLRRRAAEGAFGEPCGSSGPAAVPVTEV
ncbi:hypothetical protein [Methylobacterium soli]|uniref:Uncharacterized protein n=1 Tax=Methylobacterium soli TaxID=553447 RepID=A0A6L3SVJ1_9HYPH|nr:hypothetical protein [Methylobacterium soli]KAB1077762.1 hypothetical protein F6X53_17540 [Methylobacterium soli]GJE42888.1 hypothetical protein AEGHOMDF_2062 [Methylobacterium soli]